MKLTDELMSVELEKEEIQRILTKPNWIFLVLNNQE